MEYVILITEAWMIWITGIVVGLAFLNFLGKNRRTDVHPGMATTSETFSMKSIFLNFNSGEASLFFTSIAILGMFYCLALGIARGLTSLLPGGGA